MNIIYAPLKPIKQNEHHNERNWTKKQERRNQGK